MQGEPITESDAQVAVSNCLDVVVPAITAAGVDVNLIVELGELRWGASAGAFFPSLFCLPWGGGRTVGWLNRGLEQGGRLSCAAGGCGSESIRVAGV